MALLGLCFSTSTTAVDLRKLDDTGRLKISSIASLCDVCLTAVFSRRDNVPGEAMHACTAPT